MKETKNKDNVMLKEEFLKMSKNQNNKLSRSKRTDC